MTDDTTPVQTSEQPGEQSLYERTKITRNGITIFKRYEGAESEYYFRVQVQGKRHMRKLLRTADQSFKQARNILDQLALGRFDVLEDIAARRVKTHTVADLIKLYKTAPVDASKDTRDLNIRSLEIILARSLELTDDQVHAADIAKIDGALGRKWFSDSRLLVQKQEDQIKAQSLMKSSNSRFAQASSLFTPRAIQHYADNDLEHPGFAEFIRVMQTHRFTRLASPHYNPPSDEIIQNTLKAWQEVENRNLFLALGHEFAFGLRAGEVAQVRWAWWQTRQGYPVLDSFDPNLPVQVKNSSGKIQVRALDPFFSIMRTRAKAEGWIGEPADYILTGTETDRLDNTFRAVSEWMRGLGWKTKKTNHALRAWSGSQIAMKFGLFEASSWLRHSSVKVTEEHYTYFINTFRPADLDTIPVRWATAAQEFVPKILPAVAG